MRLPAPTNNNVVITHMALIDSNNGCGVRDGLACEKCLGAAQRAIRALAQRRRLVRPPTGFRTDLRGPWPKELPDNHPDVVIVQKALNRYATQAKAHKSALEAAKVIIACLYRHGRLAPQKKT